MHAEDKPYNYQWLEQLDYFGIEQCYIMMDKYLLIRHADRVLCFKKHKSLADLLRDNWF